MSGQVPLMGDSRAQEVIRLYNAAASGRGNWESTWEEIAMRILPQYSNTFTNRDPTLNNGQQRTENMVDATGALALPKFAAAMESMLTPRGQTWHTLRPLEATLKRNRSAMMWYDDATQALFRYRYAPLANYASQQHEIYMGLGAFGTGCMYVDKLRDYDKGLRYKQVHLGEVYFLENHQGIVDTVIRRFKLTPRQAVQKFKDTCPKEIADKKDKPEANAGTATGYWFLHCVTTRSRADGYDPKRLDVKGMRWSEDYVSETGQQLCYTDGKETGYHTFPYMVSRYVVAPGDTYGRSPAMLALPSLKVINEVKRTMLKQGHRTVDPVLLTQDDSIIAGFSLRPGAMNSGGVSADGKPLVHALPVGDLKAGKDEMDQERQIINDAFLVTLFEILIDTPQMTATEVLERARQRGALLSPTMGRQQSESLGPQIDRELDVLAMQGLLPPPPAILMQARLEYEAYYDSPLSRAQRAEQASGALQLVNWLRDIVSVTQDLSVLDRIDFDAMVPDLADISAMPVRWTRDDASFNAVRAQRNQQAKLKQATDAAPALASVAKALPTARINVSAQQ